MELQDVIEAGCSVDDFVLTMSENVNRQSTVKLKVPKNRKSKTKSPYIRCPYTLDWVDESSNESNYLTTTDK